MQNLAARPVPVAPDGRYDSEVKPLTGAVTDADPHSDLYKTVHGIADSMKDVPLIIQEVLDPKVCICFC